MASAASATSVNLSWTAPSSSGTDAITDYSVQYSTDQSTWTSWAHTASTTASATITGLTAGTIYWFRVAAVTSVAGSYSSAVSPGTSVAAGTTNGSGTALTGFSVPSTTTGTVRVLLRTTNPSGLIWSTGAAGLAGIRNTANYQDTSFVNTTISAPGQMVGYVGTAAAVNTALANLRYQSLTASTDSIQMWVSNGTEYIPIVPSTSSPNSAVQFHYYGYVGASVSYANAVSSSYAGASRTIDGVTLSSGSTGVAGTLGTGGSIAGTPFLATAQYLAEDRYLLSLIGTNPTWLNATSTSSTGTYTWQGLDAAGVQFWSGGTGGSALNGQYTNWGRTGAVSGLFEPGGDSGSSPGCMDYYYSTAYTYNSNNVGWNDSTCTVSLNYAWEAYNTGAPYGSNTSSPAAANYSGSSATTITSFATPSAPQALTASSTSTGQINLSWTAPSSAGSASITGYTVQYSSDGATWTTASSTVTGTSYSVTGLTSGTYYHLRVAANTSIGTGAWAAAYFTPAGTPQVTAVIATAKTLSNLTLSSSLNSYYVRVLLRASNSNAALKLASYANLTGIAGTSNYTTTAGASSMATAGQMIGLVGTGAAVNTALATLSYTASAVGNDTVSMWVSVGTTSAYPQEYAAFINSTTGQVEFHYYGYVSTSVDWGAARTAAAALTPTINGVTVSGSYLATDNTASDHILLNNAASSGGLNGRAWLNGGTYVTAGQSSSNSWYWLGPDTGVSQFWTGSPSTAGTTTGYSNWGAGGASTYGEPNGIGNQNCLALANSAQYSYAAVNGTIASNSTASWDDYSCSTASPYLWEYVATAPVGSSTLGNNYVTESAQSILVQLNSTAPTAVTAVAAGSSSMVVSWTAPTTVYASGPISGYNVAYSTNSGMSGATTVATGSATPQYILTGLTAGTTYYVTVTPTGSGWTGTGPVSATASGTTPSSSSITITVVASGGGTAGTNYYYSNGVIAATSSVSVNAADLQTALASGNVQIAADTVVISSAVSWSANTVLKLGASSASTVQVNAKLTASGSSGGLVLTPAACTYNSSTNIFASTGCYSLAVNKGASIVLSGSGATLSIGSTAYTVVNNNTSTLLSLNSSSVWALGAPITLTGSSTTAWLNYSFTGILDGLGNTISGMTLAPTVGQSSNGFYASLSGATVRNIGFTNASASVSTNIDTYIGAVAGNCSVSGTSTLTQVWAGLTLSYGSGVNGTEAGGGLCGSATGGTLTISRSFAVANFSSLSAYFPLFGGILGTNYLGFSSYNSVGATVNISESYTTGSIYTKLHNGTVNSQGGIVGYPLGNMTVTDVFSWINPTTDTSTAVTTAGISGWGSLTIAGGCYTTYTSVNGNSSGTTYSNGATCITSSSTTNATSITGSNWTNAPASVLANVMPPAQTLYVKVTPQSSGLYSSVGTSIVDASGNSMASVLSNYGISVSGTPSFDTITSSSAAGSYSVNYSSGLSLSGGAASQYTLSPYTTASTVVLGNLPQTVTWAPTTAIVYSSGTATPSATPTSPGGGAISYALSSAGTTGCTVNASTGVISYTAKGTCAITATAAAGGMYASASTTVSFVISYAAPIAPTVTVAGGSATGQLNVSWTAPSTSTTGGTIASYNVQYSTDNSTWTGAGTGLTGTSTTITGLTNNTGYYVQVQAVNSDGLAGAWSAATATKPYWKPTNSVAPSVAANPVGGVSVSAVDGTWDGNGNTITSTTYQWQLSADGSTNWTNLSGATASSYTPLASQAGQYLRVQVTKTNSAGGTSVNSGASTQVLSGLASVPQTVSTSRGNAQVTVSWAAPASLNGGTITGYKVLYSSNGGTSWTTASSSVSASATSYTVTGLTNGTAYSVEVLATTAAGDSTAAVASGTTTPYTAPSNSVVPTITGTTAVGFALSASTGTWAANGTTPISYSYQWQSATSANGSYTAISGATSASYSPVAGDVGNYLEVVVTATNADGASASATSAATSVVQTGLAAAPSGLTATASNGQLVLSWTAPTTLNGGVISDYLVQYRVSGATSWSTFTHTASTSASATVTGLANATAYDWQVAAVTAAGTGAVASYTADTNSTPYTVPSNSSVPTIVGSTIAAGVALSATVGAWSANGRSMMPTYQWQSSANGTSGWTNITGATSNSYTPVSGDVGKFLQVIVTETNTAGGVSATSAASTVVLSGLAAAPTGLTATASNGQLVLSWTAPTVLNGGTISDYTVQYRASGASSWSTFTHTASTATSATVTGLTNATAYDWQLAAVTGAGTGTIASYTANTASTPFIAPSNTAVPAVTGTAAVGRVLSASTGSWTANGASPLSYGYQWQSATSANGSYTAISGATSASYTPVAGDVGNYLQVVVTATNANGASATATSAATSVVLSGLAAAPTGLTASASNGQLVLSWTAPTALNGGVISNYTVQYRASGASSWTTAAVGSAATNLTVAALTNGTGYDWKVNAVTTAGAGTVASYTANTASTPYTIPSNAGGADLPVVTGTAADSVQLSASTGNWSVNGAGPLSYSYQWMSASTANGSYTAISGATSSTYTPASGDVGKYLEVAVTATNANGASSSAVLSAPTAAVQTGRAGAPTNLTTVASDGQLVLSWTAPTTLNGGTIIDYTVYYKPSGGSTWTTYTHSPSTATSATITGLTNGTSYLWQVDAVTAAGDGTVRNYAANTASTPYAAPLNTAVPAVSGTPANTIQLTASTGSWTANGASPLSYSYQWRSATSANGSYAAISGATSASYTPGATDVGKYLQVVVTATNANGASATATSAATSVVLSGLANAPTGFAAVSATSPSIEIDASWTAPSGSALNGASAITGYEVDTSLDGSSWTAASTSIAANATSYAITGLTPGISYWVRVAAQTAAGTGAWATTNAAVMLAAAAVNTTAPVVTGVTSVGEVLSTTDGTWDYQGLSNTGTSYQWQRSATGTSGWTNISGATASSYTLTTADAGKFVQVVVTVSSLAGNASAAAVVAGTGANGVIETGLATVPQSVVVTPGDQMLNLSWAAPNTLTGGTLAGYTLRYSTDGSTWTTTTLGNVTSATIAALTNGTGYYVQVAARTAAGVGSWGGSSSTSYTPFGAPINTVLPSWTGNTSVGETVTATDGTWNSNGSALTNTSYLWEYQNSSSVWVSLSTTASATITSAASGRPLRLTVTVTNAAGSVSALSNTATVLSGIAGAPTSATATANTAGGISVSWQDPSTLNGGTIQKYVVRWTTDGTTPTPSNGNASSNIVVASAVNGVYQYTIATHLTLGTLTRVRVFPYTLAGAGTGTGTLSATPIAPATVALPTLSGGPVVGIAFTGTEGAVTSTGGSAITGTAYQWQESADGLTGWTDISGATAISYTPVTADAGQFVRLIVTKTNGAGPTAATSAASTVVQSGLAGAPTGLAASAANGQLTLSWNTAPTLSGGVISDYLVQYRVAGATSWTTFAHTAATTTSATITGLTNATGYDWQVAAVTAAGTGAVASYVADTNSTPFTTPSNTALPAITGTAAAGIVLTASTGTWTANGRAVTGTSYQWQVSTDGSTWNNVTSGGTAASYTVPTGYVGDELRVVVSASNLAGSTSATSAATATVQTGLAAAPSGLTSVAGNGQLTLSWTAPTVLNGGVISDYSVQYRASGSTGSWTTVAVGSTATSLTVTGLTNATGYDWQVDAVTAAGDGAVASYAADTNSTPYTQPSNTVLPVVSGVVAVAQTLTASTGSWNVNGAGPLSYGYQWQSASTANGSYTAITGATSASYTPVTADAGSFLQVVVTATNANGSSASITSAATVALASGLAAAPSGLTAVASNTQLVLSWTAPATLNGGVISDYTVKYRAHGSTGAWTTANVGSTVTNLTVAALTNATAYDWTVAAVTAAGTGAAASYTADLNSTPFTLPSNTALPVLTGTAAAGIALSASTGIWNDNGRAVTGTSYQWQVSTDGSTWNNVASGGGSANYTVPASYVGDTLRAIVTATNAAGSVSATSAATATVQTGLAAAPSGLTSVAGNGQLTLSWTAPTVLNGGIISDYSVQYRASGSTGSWTAVAVGSTATSLTVTGLSNATGYDWQVAAVTAAGDGAVGSYAANTASTPYTAPASTTPPGITGAATAVGVTLSASTGSWNVNGVSPLSYSYQWQSAPSANGSYTAITGATSASYTPVTADAGSYLQVVVTATNASGASASIASPATTAVASGLAAAPSGLTAVASNTQLVLSWTAPTVLNGGTVGWYLVQYRAHGSTGLWSSTNVTSGATSVTIAALTNATGYDWSVAAYTAAGIGAAASYTADTNSTPFWTPINTALPAVSGSAAVLGTLSGSDGSWNSNGRTLTGTTYQWQISADGLSGWANIAGATAASYSPVTADFGHYLRLVVTASNLAGSVQATSASSGQVGAGPADAPTNLLVTRGDHALTLAWTAPASTYGGTLTDYTVQISTDNGASWTAVTHTASTGTSLTASNLTLGSTVLMRVRGESQVAGTWAAPASATVIGAPTAVSPGVITGTPLLGQVLSVSNGSWTANGAAVASYRYQWQRSTDGVSNWTNVSGATNASMTIAIANVYYRTLIWATNEAGESVSAATSPISPYTVTQVPNAPGNLTVTPGDGQLVLSWNQPTQLGGGSISDYTVEWSTDGSTWTQVSRTASATASQTITGLSNGTDYYVRVAGISTVLGNYALFTPDTIHTMPYGAPINLALPTVYGSNVSFGHILYEISDAWADNGNPLAATSYQWQSSIDNGATWTAIAGATASSYQIGEVVGAKLRVLVTRADQAGLTTTVASAATATVAAVAATAPRSIVLTPGDHQIGVSWQQPLSLGGSLLQSYVVEYSTDQSNWTTVTRSSATATTETITGLTNGSSYYVRVHAVTALTGALGYDSTPMTPYGLPINTVAVVASGTAQFDQTLTATGDSWNSNGAAITATSYQWQVSTDAGASWTNIAGATSANYVVGPYVGDLLRVHETVTNLAGNTVSNSAATATVVAAAANAATGLGVVAGDQQLTVSWTAPSYLGGAAITDYTVQTSTDQNTWTSFAHTASASTSMTVTGLTNGTGYYLRVRAENGASGGGAWVSTSAVSTPYGLPINTAMPTISGTVAYDQQLSATAGSWNSNGASISATSYQWQVSTNAGTSWTDISGATSANYTVGAYVGDLLRVRVTSTNQRGQTTQASAATASVAPAPAGAPTGLTVTAGDQQLSLGWTAPGYLGGAAITDYTVQTSTDGSSWTTVAHSASTVAARTVTGLANGTPYYVRVRAENGASAGGAWATSSNTAVPFGLPMSAAVPTISGTVTYDQQLSATAGSWNNNGASISATSYQWQVSTDAGASWTNIAGATSATYVVGPYVGDLLRVRVTATNQAGNTMQASAATASVAPAAPGAPTGLTVTASNQQLALSWTAPSYLGGAAISNYEVQTSTDGSTWLPVTRAASNLSSQTVTGLTNGTDYYLRLRALNGANGAWLMASGTATPYSVPVNISAPTVSGTLVYGQPLSASSGVWDADGAAITGTSYQWQTQAGSTWTNIAGATAASYTIASTVGQALRVLVTTSNAAGSTTQASAATAAVAPAAPSAPLQPSATPADQQLTLTWAAPASNGGAAITDYQVQMSTDGNTWTSVARAASTTPSQIITGLTNGTDYYLRVRAENGANGAWAFVSSPARPRGLPAVVQVPTVTGQASFHSVLATSDGVWNENGDGISQTSYQWQASADAGISWQNIPGATQSSYTIGLYVGSIIRAQVTVSNAAGSSTAVSAASPTVTAIPAATPQLTSQSIGNGQVTLGWTPPVHTGGVSLIGYTLQYSTDQSTWTSMALNADTTSATITGLANGTGYYARVRAETLVLSGDWSSVEGPFVPVAPVVRSTPSASAPAASASPSSSSAADLVRTMVMPIAPSVSTLQSLTGPTPVTVTSDGRIELQPTQSVALLNGQPVSATVSVQGNTIAVQTSTVSLAVQLGATADASGSGSSIVTQGDSASASGSGFAASSPVAVWIQSTPTKLSETTAAADGSASQQFMIPAGITPGSHTIQINGVDANGDVVSVIYGVQVLASASTAATAAVVPTELPWWFWPLVSALLVAFVLGFGLGWYRRSLRR